MPVSAIALCRSARCVFFLSLPVFGVLKVLRVEVLLVVF
jgi:hypothetical protein